MFCTKQSNILTSDSSLKMHIANMIKGFQTFSQTSQCKTLWLTA